MADLPWIESEVFNELVDLYRQGSYVSLQVGLTFLSQG